MKKSLLLFLFLSLFLSNALGNEKNKIYYTSSDGQIIDVNFDHMISNSYENGQGCIVFSEDVNIIYWLDFRECKTLTSIIIPEIVVCFMFEGCSSLTSITIPNSVTTIGSSAFEGCSSLTSITIPNSVTSIGDEAFLGCTSLTSITIPNSVTTIGSWAFNGCTSLTSITIPNSVREIDWGAFISCTSLTSITIPNSVTSIESFAFQACTSLTSITIPNSVTTIGSWAFDGCTSLTSITIPNSVREIDWGAFNSCTSLTSITIPNSVTSIGQEVFSYCSSLCEITLLGPTPPIASYKSFSEMNRNCAIKVPNEAFEAYLRADGWNVFKNMAPMYSSSITGTIDGHEYVDLMLPSGTLWATCNIGAYAWGETETKSDYSWSTYMCLEEECGTDKDPLKDYLYPSPEGIAGTDYDVAHVKWGGSWVMPTAIQLWELRTSCLWVWTNSYNNSNIKGYILYNINPSTSDIPFDTHLFLPCSDYLSSNSSDNVGWTVARGFDSEDSWTTWQALYQPRYIPGSVRPVVSKTNNGETAIENKIVNSTYSKPVSLDGKPVFGKPSGIFIQDGKKKILK